MLTALKKEHPRLYINTQHIKTLKELKNIDAFFNHLVDSLIREADRIVEQPPTEFQIVGPRMLKNCQQILKRVSALALIFNITENSKYLERAKQELFAAAEFPHWNQSHFLDTAELCTAFGIGYDWLYHGLGEGDKRLLKNGLVEKGLRAGLEEYEKKAWWMSVNNNWNVVCHGGLAIGALSVADEEPEIAESILTTAMKNIPLVLQTFEPDGAWPAGPEYWEYTTQYCVLFIDALYTALGIDIDHFNISGLSEAGLFPIHCSGPFDKYFNFADADPESNAKPTLYWLGQKYNMQSCINENFRLLQKQLDEDKTPDAFDLIWYKPQAKGVTELPKAAYFKGTENVFIRNKWNDPDAVFIGMNGGSNQADHAHLDLGSFIIDAHGVRWATDLGRDNYDLPDYWDMTEGGGRWKYFRLNNKSHNTLVINDDVQRAEATASVVRHRFSKNKSFAILDLTKAYSPHTESVMRGIAMIDGELIIIQDEIIWCGKLKKLRWQLMTDADIKLAEFGAEFNKGGKSFYANIQTPLDSQFKVMSAHKNKPENPNYGFKQLVMDYSEKNQQTIIYVVMANEPMKLTLKPLQEW